MAGGDREQACGVKKSRKNLRRRSRNKITSAGKRKNTRSNGKLVGEEKKILRGRHAEEKSHPPRLRTATIKVVLEELSKIKEGEKNTRRQDHIGEGGEKI